MRSERLIWSPLGRRIMGAVGMDTVGVGIDDMEPAGVGLLDGDDCKG